MDKKQVPERPDEWLKDIPLRGDDAIGFAPVEMLACPQCGRPNPPTRTACLYCARELPATDTQSRYLKSSARRLEAWEKCFNVVYLPGGAGEATAPASAVARRLGADAEGLELVLRSGKILPLARLESAREAEILREKLSESGIRAAIVADEALQTEIFNRRLRSIEFGVGEIYLRLFNTGESVGIAAGNLRLIVVGAIFERKIESTETVKRKKEAKAQETAETSFDVPVVDLYAGDDPVGYRIEPSGFDFSGLGAEKSLLAAENMRRLAERLRQIAPAAAFDDDYKTVRAALSRVWAVEERTDAGGVGRRGLGSLSRKSVTIINNSGQFNRYSRLRRILL